MNSAFKIYPKHFSHSSRSHNCLTTTVTTLTATNAAYVAEPTKTGATYSIISLSIRDN